MMKSVKNIIYLKQRERDQSEKIMKTEKDKILEKKS